MKYIGIIAAMSEEIASIKKLMSDISVKNIYELEFTLGTIHSKNVVLVKCGVGKVNAARTASIPNVPTALFSSPAPASRDSDASDTIPPTTGIMPDMASLAVFNAAASALPEIMPVDANKPVNKYKTVFRIPFTDHPIISRILPSLFCPKAESASPSAKNAYSIGVTMTLQARTNRSQNSDETV